MTSEFTIRGCGKPGDRSRLERLGLPPKYIAQYTNSPPLYYALMRLGICASFFYLMTGQDADKVLGTILLRKRFSLAARGYHWKIHAVYVDPELRGRGLGVELVRFALGELAGWRVAEVSLKVDEDNEPAIRLYRKCGFEEKEKANGQLIMVKTVEQARERRRLP